MAGTEYVTVVMVFSLFQHCFFFNDGNQFADHSCFLVNFHRASVSSSAISILGESTPPYAEITIPVKTSNVSVRSTSYPL
jgi:hypothetical protein